MRVWLAPGIGAPPADVPLRLTGHFDDPRAAQCEPTDDDRGRLGASADSGAWLDCRVRFVITGFERVDR